MQTNIHRQYGVSSSFKHLNKKLMATLLILSAIACLVAYTSSASSVELHKRRPFKLCAAKRCCLACWAHLHCFSASLIQPEYNGRSPSILSGQPIRQACAKAPANLCERRELPQPQIDPSEEEKRKFYQVKRALYELPDGAESIIGPNIRTSFTCSGLGYGYYADQDNDCKIFHICQSFKMSDGSIYNNHWSFMCGNQTIFNQVSLSCSHPEDSVPCESAKDFYYVNDYFGDLQAPSVKEADLNLAQDLVSRAYGSRISTSATEN